MVNGVKSWYYCYLASEEVPEDPVCVQLGKEKDVEGKVGGETEDLIDGDGDDVCVVEDILGPCTVDNSEAGLSHVVGERVKIREHEKVKKIDNAEQIELVC